MRENIEPLALQSFCAWISNITQDGILTLTFADMDITREAMILLEYFSERIITINYTHCTGVTEEHYKKIRSFHKKGEIYYNVLRVRG